MTTYQSVDPQTLKNWLDHDEAVLIDVRQPEEYRLQSIPGALHIPLGMIGKNLIPPVQNKKLVIHCGIGKRGSMACEKLITEDSNLTVYNLAGGITAWKKAGLPLDHGKISGPSLERQIQIGFGTLILLSLLLGFFIHPSFLLITVIIGIIMLLIGITGSTLLLILIGKLPWNKL